jgi:hypothetical protein
MSLISEPSMRWYGMKDDRNNLVALKIPISACDSSRKPLKSIGRKNTQTSIRNISLKDTGVLTSDSEDEAESAALLGRTVSVRCDEKQHVSNTKSGKSNKCRTLKEENAFKTRSVSCRTKLKDKDISQLLDDDNTQGSASLPAVQHIDDKLAKSSNSESCTNKLKHVYHTSAKNKLFYEDNGTKRKFSCGDSPDRCNITDASPVLKDERNVGPGKVTDGRTELSTSKVGCTGNSINCLEPVHNSKTVDYYVESPKNSETLNRCQDHLQKNVSSKSCCCCSVVQWFFWINYTVI